MHLVVDVNIKQESLRTKACWAVDWSNLCCRGRQVTDSFLQQVVTDVKSH